MTFSFPLSLTLSPANRCAAEEERTLNASLVDHSPLTQKSRGHRVGEQHSVIGQSHSAIRVSEQSLVPAALDCTGACLADVNLHFASDRIQVDPVDQSNTECRPFTCTLQRRDQFRFRGGGGSGFHSFEIGGGAAMVDFAPTVHESSRSRTGRVPSAPSQYDKL